MCLAGSDKAGAGDKTKADNDGYETRTDRTDKEDSTMDSIALHNELDRGLDKELRFQRIY